MRTILTIAALSWAMASPVLAQMPEAAPAQASPVVPAIDHPSGTYVLDPGHASVIWRVRHLGLSMYTGRFNGVSATLELNADAPGQSSLQVNITAASVDTDHPDEPGRTPFNETVANRALGAQANPTITFVSTRIESLDGQTGRVTGDLTLNGVTRPVTLDVTFNGGRLVLITQKYTLGFSARGTFNRSDFGADAWSSAVDDTVEIIIEAEFHRQ
jgi:polyisoprenoid-binding protein YceI